MARPRKPTLLHIVSGSAKKDPQRMRQRENEPTEIGEDLRDMEAPEHLDEATAKLWNDLRPMLHPRTAGQNDALAFECLVRLVQRIRAGGAIAAEFARATAIMGEFGMTPASRSKVAQKKVPEEKKGFAALRNTG